MNSLLVLCALVSTPQTPDLTTIDGTIKELYAVISGPAGQKRDWVRFKNLFSKEGKLMATATRKDRTVVSNLMTPDDYIKQSGPFLEERGFFESELHRKVDQFDSVAHVFSTYESRMKPDEKPFTRGINSIQMWFDGKRWWIQSLVWVSETADKPIPKEYLPGK